MPARFVSHSNEDPMIFININDDRGKTWVDAIESYR